jgi:amidase
MVTSELHWLNLSDLARRIEAGEVSSLAATEHILHRIEQHNPRLHAYVTSMADSALEEAENADRERAAGKLRGPLHGVPLAVKDLCDTAGVPTAAGTRVMVNRVPARDATVVKRLRDAGAVILGKLAMTEGAFSEHHPDVPVPVNPWSPQLWSGVSSSGSGVATAAGLCFAALGSDTGGSIRLPSAMNAVVGIKPTYGRVPVTGIFPMGASLDHVGPLCRSVLDAAVVLGVLAGFDEADPRSLRRPVEDYAAAARPGPKGLEGLRVGFDPSACGSLDQDLIGFVSDAVEVLARLGADVRQVTLPSLDAIPGHWSILCGAEMLVAHEAFFPSRRDDYGPALRMFLEMSEAVPSRELARASIESLDFSGRFQRVFDQVDVVASPTLGVRMLSTMSASDPETFARMPAVTRFTAPFNLSRNPTISLPCGWAADGFPASLQLVGRHFEETVIIRAAAAYEAATTWHSRRPPAPAP